MHIALHPAVFTTPEGPAGIGPVLARAVTRAEEAGVHSIWPMDHFFQIPVHGPSEDPMLEGYAAIAWAAALTTRIELGTLVTGVHYRHPGVLLKTLTTVDVLSGGRSWLGVGAGWNEEESRGLGVPFPPMKERFERLEETLRIAHRMFDGDETPYHGAHYDLERPMNHPAPVRRPPVMVGGGGERKTLRYVAEYGDACNLFEFMPQAELRRKLDVLRGHCADLDRPYDEIVRTTTGQIRDLDVARAVDRFGRLSELGVDIAMLDLPDPSDEKVFDFLADVIRQVAPLGRPLPERVRPVATPSP
ncbi:MAG: LLM class F420-dependent oxidoreductase [Streptosporangiales bacterium]|nr:LLM class F420-dependent oxidoreductase [Streptosporangiales bacterium]MBO0891010.1 LLM class F420-dependent oxidoreductase [Acidothermales bacterium]